MMEPAKNLIRTAMQSMLGFRRYLFVFSRVNVFRIRALRNERAFRYFTAMISGDGAILDIGANIGFMTVHLAKEHPRSTIYAIEPIPENYRTLAKMIDFYRLGNVQLCKTAVGDSNGEIRMIMPGKTGSRMQGLSHVFEEASDQHVNGNLYTVPVQKLDDIPALQQLTKISAIKIDVENFEYYVLKGGEQLIAKHRPVIFCELWDNERRQWCFDFVKKMGYRVMILEHGQLAEYKGQDELNYFFLP